MKVNGETKKLLEKIPLSEFLQREGYAQEKIAAAISFSKYLADPGNKHRTPALQADSLPSEPPGKSIKKINLKKNLQSE